MSGGRFPQPSRPQRRERPKDAVGPGRIGKDEGGASRRDDLPHVAGRAADQCVPLLLLGGGFLVQQARQPLLKAQPDVALDVARGDTQRARAGTIFAVGVEAAAPVKTIEKDTGKRDLDLFTSLQSFEPYRQVYQRREVARGVEFNQFGSPFSRRVSRWSHPIQRIVVGQTSRQGAAGGFDILVVWRPLPHIPTPRAAHCFLERTVLVALPGEPLGGAGRTAGRASGTVERGQVAAQGHVSFETIGQAGEGGVERVGARPAQPQAGGDEEQGVDAEAHRAATGCDCLSHNRRPLAEQVHHQITGHGEGAHISPRRPDRLNGAVAGQGATGRTGSSRDEPGSFRHV